MGVVMTVYSGSVNVSANRPDLGDGDETAFNISVSGSLTANITVGSGGVLSGNATLNGSASGHAVGDTDGDSDDFSDSGTDTDAVSGTTASGVDLFFLIGDAFVEFKGSFDSSLSKISGN